MQVLCWKRLASGNSAVKKLMALTSENSPAHKVDLEYITTAGIVQQST